MKWEEYYRQDTKGFTHIKANSDVRKLYDAEEQSKELKRLYGADCTVMLGMEDTPCLAGNTKK